MIAVEPVVETIDRIERPSVETFVRDYLNPGRPVVIRGEMEHWPATGKWTFDFLREICADRVIPVRYFSQGARNGLEFSVKKMGLKEYFDIICSDRPDRDRYYIATVLAEDVFPEVIGEIGRPSYVPNTHLTRKIARPTVWVGSDNFTQLHYHPGTEVISSQVLGNKHFTLFPPSEQRHLYANPWWSNRFNWSRVNYFRYDDVRDQYPDLKRARRIECVLQPGEQIYIPPYWWHAVHNEGPAILITAFWKSSAKMPLFSPQGIGTAVWPIVRRLKTAVLRRSHTD